MFSSNSKNKTLNTFSNGILLPNDGNNYNPPLIDESLVETTKYIPYDFAENKIQLLNNEIYKVKEKYENRINELTSYYKKYIDKLNNNYNVFILDMKEKSDKYVNLSNSISNRLELDLRQEIKSKDVLIEELHDIAAENNKQYQTDMKTMKLKLKELENLLNNTIDSYTSDNIINSCDYVISNMISSIEINYYINIEKQLINNVTNYKQQIDLLTSTYELELYNKSIELDIIKDDIFINEICYDTILSITTDIEILYYNDKTNSTNSHIDSLITSYTKTINQLHSNYISNEIILKSILECNNINYHNIINRHGQLNNNSILTINELESQLKSLQSYELQKSIEYEQIFSQQDNEIRNLTSYQDVYYMIECEVVLNNIISNIEYMHTIDIQNDLNVINNQLVSVINKPIIISMKDAQMQTMDSIVTTTVEATKNTNNIIAVDNYTQADIMTTTDIAIQVDILPVSVSSNKLTKSTSKNTNDSISTIKISNEMIDNKNIIDNVKSSNYNENTYMYIEDLLSYNIEIIQRYDKQLAIIKSSENNHIDNLEDIIYDLKNEITALNDEKNELVDKNNFILHQLENMTNEKRTDLVKKYENEINLYQTNLLDLNNQLTSLKSQQLKDQLVIKELTERVEISESELKQKELLEIENNNNNKEKTLQIQINKQRDMVILKTKAATAGWDAAAVADEKLEIEIDKAYKKGLIEGRKQHEADMKELNSAIELKENHLTELVVKMNELENKLRDSELLIIQYQNESNQAKLELSDTILMFESINEGLKNGLTNQKSSIDDKTASNITHQPFNENNTVDKINSIDESNIQLGHTTNEFDQLKDLLDQAQDEIIQLTDKLDSSENKLQLLAQRIDIYEQLLSLQKKKLVDLPNQKFSTINNSSTNVIHKESEEDELVDIISNIKASLTRGSALWKSNKRDECYDMYLTSNESANKKLLNYPDLKKLFFESIASVKALVIGHSNMKPKAAMILKKTMEKFVSQAEIVVNNFKDKQTDKSSGHIDEVPTMDDDETTKEMKDLQNQLDVLTSLYYNSNNTINNTITTSNDEEVNELTDELTSGNVQSHVEGSASESDNTATSKEIVNDSVIKISDSSPLNNNNQINSSESTNKIDSKSNDVSKDSSLLRRAKDAEDQVEKLKKQIALILTVKSNNNVDLSSMNFNIDSNNPTALSSDYSNALSNQPTTSSISFVPTTFTRLNTKPVGSHDIESLENRRLHRKIKELENQISNLKSSSTSNEPDKKVYIQLEKTLNKKIKDIETNNKKEKIVSENKIIKLEKLLEQKNNLIDPITKERDMLRGKIKDYNILLDEVMKLRKVSDNYNIMSKQLEDKTNEYIKLNEIFKKEFNLRKKYKNDLEDLKGAIRVFARCRPFAQYEIEKQCQSVVQFKDETSMNLFTSRGERFFEFDNIFDMASTQEQVFEEAQRLVESFLDGFNVCIFAYGQTGSGKTFTMTGTPESPGLTPRAIKEMFALMNERTQCTFNISTYFVEIYNDNLVDLFWSIDNKNTGVVRNVDGSLIEPPRLDIKMDNRKMVTITNVVIKQANTYDDLMYLFELGNSERHVGATKMNQTSSRSHAIFSIMVEIFDKTTKRNTYGKLSLVDLAGSERQDKTGATGNTLKEAQSINKSLSALGNVISALSEGEKHIPYRSNKLTQLMQDSLGGNAKTLMFVNFSPADYNVDETYSSLNYATRVKKIVNNANKQADSEEVSRLKTIIKKLQSGQTVLSDEINGVTSNNDNTIVEETNEDNVNSENSNNDNINDDTVNK